MITTQRLEVQDEDASPPSAVAVKNTLVNLDDMAFPSILEFKRMDFRFNQNRESMTTKGVNLLVLATLLLIGVLSSCQSTPAPSAPFHSTSPFSGVGGDWRGFTMDSGKGVQLDLVVHDTRDDSGQLTADLSRSDFLSGKSLDSWKLVLEYDSLLQSFTWRTDARSHRYPNPRIRSVSGLVDSDENRLVCTGDMRVSSARDLMVFCRPEDYGLLTTQLRAILDKNRGMEFGRLGKYFSSAPSVSEMLTWLEPFLELDRRRTRDLQWRRNRDWEVIPMLADPTFALAFGKPFEGMSSKELHDVYEQLLAIYFERITPDRRKAAPSENETELGYLYSNFRLGGTPSAIDSSLGVLAYRIGESWRAQVLDSLNSKAGTSPGWDLGDSLLAAIEAGGVLNIFWEEPVQQFEQNVASVRNACADPKAEQVLSDSLKIQDPVARARALSAWTQGFEFLRHMSQLESKRLRDLRDNALELAVSEVLSPYHNSLDAISEEAHGLAETLDWYNQLAADQKPYMRTKAFADLRADFIAKRARLFQIAEPTIKDKIAAASPREVLPLARQWFPLAADRETDVWRSIEAITKERIAEILVNYERLELLAIEQNAGSPEHPLRFINFLGYPANHVFEYIYYGTGNPLDDVPESRRFAAHTKLQFTLRSLFLTYHDKYLERFGRTERERRNQNNGREWASIRSGTVTKDSWGNVLSSSVHHFTWVRPEFAEVYRRSMPTEADLLGGALVMAITDNQAKKRGEKGVDMQELADLYVSPLENSRGVLSFLDAFAIKHPATLKHFEENLLRALEGQPLKQISRLRESDL